MNHQKSQAGQIWDCPICGKKSEDGSSICTGCGYDRSTDYEEFPTFAPVGMVPSRNSRCTEVNADGSVTVGVKINGIWQGFFQKTFPDGRCLRGTYVDGRIEGELTDIEPDGTVTRGVFHNGWNGPFTQTYPEGAFFEGVLVNGEPEGLLRYVDENGKVTQRQWNKAGWKGKK